MGGNSSSAADDKDRWLEKLAQGSAFKLTLAPGFMPNAGTAPMPPGGGLFSAQGFGPKAGTAPGSRPGFGFPPGSGTDGVTAPKSPEKDIVALTVVEGDKVHRYLRQHGLGLAGPNLVLDAKKLTAAEVVRILIRELHLSSHETTVTEWVEDYARGLRDPAKLRQGGGPAQTKAGAGGPAPTYQLSYAFVPVTAHMEAGTGQTSVDGPQHQITLGATIALHPDRAAGPELSWQLQVAADGDTFKVATIVGGVQAAWVAPFLKGALQISALVSAATGVSRGKPSASGTVSMVPTSQLGAGGQVTYAVPGTGGTVQIGFQVAASVTSAQGSNPTADFSPQAFMQIQWN